MALAITTPHDPGESLRAILDAEAAGAARELTRTHPPDPEDVHAARKRFKKARAVLRLLRPGVGEPARRAGTRFRDFGRELAGTRDADAMVEALDREAATLRARTEPELVDRLMEVLVRRRDAQRGATGDLADRARATAEALEAVRGELLAWTVPGEGFAVLETGLAEQYRRGRKALKACRRAPGDEAFHEWRKRVKDHWYHTRLIAGAWPEGLEARARCLKDLSDSLGFDHDLVVLRAKLEEDPGGIGDEADRARLDAAMAERQAELRGQAVGLGRRIFAEKPGAFAKRMRGYWRAWEREHAPQT